MSRDPTSSLYLYAPAHGTTPSSDEMLDLVGTYCTVRTCRPYDGVAGCPMRSFHSQVSTVSAIHHHICHLTMTATLTATWAGTWAGTCATLDLDGVSKTIHGCLCCFRAPSPSSRNSCEMLLCLILAVAEGGQVGRHAPDRPSLSEERAGAVGSIPHRTRCLNQG